jgi:hypothetical protein
VAFSSCRLKVRTQSSGPCSEGQTGVRGFRSRRGELDDKSFDSRDKSYDHENAAGSDAGEHTTHSNSCRNLREIKVVIHCGGLTLSASRLTSSDLEGSGTTLVSMKSHLGHSKVRSSESSGRGTILVRFMRMRHRTQRGRSIGESITSVSERGMLLTWRLKLCFERFFVCPIAD